MKRETLECDYCGAPCTATQLKCEYCGRHFAAEPPVELEYKQYTVPAIDPSLLTPDELRKYYGIEPIWMVDYGNVSYDTKTSISNVSMVDTPRATVMVRKTVPPDGWMDVEVKIKENPS